MMKLHSRTLLLNLILLVASVIAAGAASPVVQQHAGQSAIIVGTARQNPNGIIVGTARQNPRGIIVGTARSLRERPLHNPSVGLDQKGRLLFGLSDGRDMLLPDGVYTSKNGVQMRFHGGRITLVETVTRR